MSIKQVCTLEEFSRYKNVKAQPLNQILDCGKNPVYKNLQFN